MKKIITGASLMLTGALLFLSAFVAAGSLGAKTGWDARGPLWNAFSDNSLYPIIWISIIFMVGGIAVIIWGNLHKSD